MATGIVNIWRDEATKVAAAHRRISDAFPGRFLLGIGVGHPERTSQYQRPYASLVSYLDILEAEGVPKDELVLAALGPKVLQLAADRTAGAHPYLTTPEHTRRARQLVGPETLLAPEQKGVLTTDAQRARELARSVVVFPYLSRINYLQNLRSLGWTDNDVAGDGSDALIDALVGHGNPAAATAADQRPSRRWCRSRCRTIDHRARCRPACGLRDDRRGRAAIAVVETFVTQWSYSRLASTSPRQRYRTSDCDWPTLAGQHSCLVLHGSAAFLLSTSRICPGIGANSSIGEPPNAC